MVEELVKQHKFKYNIYKLRGCLEFTCWSEKEKKKLLMTKIENKHSKFVPLYMKGKELSLVWLYHSNHNHYK